MGNTVIGCMRMLHSIGHRTVFELRNNGRPSLLNAIGSILVCCLISSGYLSKCFTTEVSTPRYIYFMPDLSSDVSCLSVYVTVVVSLRSFTPTHTTILVTKFSCSLCCCNVDSGKGSSLTGVRPGPSLREPFPVCNGLDRYQV